MTTSKTGPEHRLAVVAALALTLLAGCREAPAGPPKVAPFTPQPTGTPRTECGDGSWVATTGPNACTYHRGVHR